MIYKHGLLIRFIYLYIFYARLNVSKDCYVSLTKQVNICHFLHSDYQTTLSLTIQFNNSHLFANSVDVKQSYMTHK